MLKVCWLVSSLLFMLFSFGDSVSSCGKSLFLLWVLLVSIGILR